MSDRQVAAAFIVAGDKKTKLPTVEEARQRFDAALTHEPTAVDREKQELLEALGVR